MTSVEEHLSEALSQLKQAKRKAGIGTGLMLGEVIEQLQDIRGRYENINDD
jgi:hypothetical protein